MGIIVAGIEFDATAGQVIVSGIEFDCQVVAPLPDAGQLLTASGGGKVTRKNVKSSPAPAPSHYHSRSDEQEIERLAAQLDDEETVIAFLMEIALHV